MTVTVDPVGKVTKVDGGVRYSLKYFNTGEICCCQYTNHKPPLSWLAS